MTTSLTPPEDPGGGVPPQDPATARNAGWWAFGLLFGLIVVAAAVWVLVVSGEDEAPPTSTTSTEATVTTEPTTTAPATTTTVVTTTTTTTTTTTAPTTTTTPATTTTTTAPVDGEATAIWPFPGEPRFLTPVAAARSFAVDLLGFVDPVVEEFQQGDTRSGEVPIRPEAEGPVTTVLVRRLSGDQGWSVIGAATERIRLDRPRVLDEISSPVRLRGEALAFEGHVVVHIRQDGDLDPIGEGFVTGGGDIMRPFDGTVEFDAPGTPYGSIVLFTASARDGQVWEAAAIRIAFAPE